MDIYTEKYLKGGYTKERYTKDIWKDIQKDIWRRDRRKIYKRHIEKGHLKKKHTKNI